jgi:hypothetical protein
MLIGLEKEFGKLPSTLREMLERFNGAELFLSGGPFVTLFRISSIPPLPALEWAPDWCVDSITRRWRAQGSNRAGDWAIAMTNDDGLVLLCADETVNEWDTAQCILSSKNVPFEEWMANLTDEGRALIAESTKMLCATNICFGARK